MPAARVLLDKCDELRDDTLPALGVLLEDQDGRTVVKYVGREEALREKAEKERLLQEKRLLKEEQKRKQEEARVSGCGQSEWCGFWGHGICEWVWLMMWSVCTTRC